MTVHLVKLCVGVDSVDDLDHWVTRRRDQQAASGEAAEHVHTTRMTPRRQKEVLDGGSLYWVIKGAVQARQRILDLRAVTGEDGVSRCEIVMEPVLVRTNVQPKRAFQGWRYLKPQDAPADRGHYDGDDELPAALQRELAELGLL